MSMNSTPLPGLDDNIVLSSLRWCKKIIGLLYVQTALMVLALFVGEAFIPCLLSLCPGFASECSSVYLLSVSLVGMEDTKTSLDVSQILSRCLVLVSIPVSSNQKECSSS